MSTSSTRDAMAIDKDRLAAAGAVIGAPARAAIVTILARGKAMTATELSVAAGVTQQTTSSHLQKLSDAGFIIQQKKGRHRYYRLAGDDISQAMVTLANLLEKKPKVPKRRNRALERLKPARMCYDHLAGDLGADIAQAMVSKGYLWPEGDGHQITRSGEIFLEELGIGMRAFEQGRRQLAPLCADWSNDTPHIGGALGAAIALRCFEEGWLHKPRTGRHLTVTAAGETAFARLFGINIHAQKDDEDADA